MDYTFRLPPGKATGFVFDVKANSDEEACEKARELLTQNAGNNGDIHVDLLYGLGFGRVIVSLDDVTPAAIVDRYAGLSANTQPF